ncbi:hypothetical protein JOB18_002918 [Solea senegalensis]|uniref:DUF4585 domain-containing protein n=1 Tax=Solea senegalensis TaxID=28829 RepID=A0AAV6S2B2_SOLSE|nr:hypothetical protein JOB18_002918 [Solea senegalensis]
MTSVEKRRSGRRKSGSHRKHSDGGFSDTSSSGSFLDETDREVSNLTDRAFRSLCIGDEAVYNDSDLCSSSPCSQRDKQLAFGQNREDRERDELKRAAHESFRLRVQQYEQDWVHGGMSGAEICRDPHWEIHGEMTQGRVSATFQHSFVESAQQEQSLREDQLSFLSNGATELSSQQRRSRSRVSSLIRTFNSDSVGAWTDGDGAWTDGKLRERYNGNSWDKTALMSIQRELSEFSNSYQQNFTRDHFPTADPFSSRNTNLYSAQVAAVAHVNSAPSFTGISHSMFNCNSNFFIHSEFSPFRVWRDHNRFPFQQEQVSGFSHHSEIPKWYETPMYKELSQEVQPQGSYRFKERGIGYSRNNLLPVVPPSPPRSTSTVLQKALAVEKRCESELMGQYTHRKRIQSLGTKRLPTQRPSTASPTTEMSRRVQETISSVKALQQKIKKMTEQNMATGMTANQQGALCSEDDLISYGHNAVTLPNVVRSNTTPLNISQLLTPSGQTHQEASVVQQCAPSPEPVEHPPVRAESRGATPDIRMSGYRSRATSLLFNLKDNRKRVKNTYSPTKFKNAEMLEKNKQPCAQQPRDTVIDIPDFPDTDIQFTHAASHLYVQQYQNPGLSFATQNPCPKSAHAGQYSEYSLSDYQTAEKQAEMVCHSTFTGFTPDNYTATQLANGQNPHEDFQSLSSYQYGMTDNVESLRGGVCGLNASYTATDTPKLTVNNQTGDYFRSNANAEQYFNETVEREFTKVERYQQPKDNKHDYSNVFSQERWRNEQDTEKLISPWKQEKTALIERDQHSQANQRAVIIKEEHNLSRDKYRGKNLNINKEVDKLDFEQSFVTETSHKSTGSINSNVSKQLPQCPQIISNDAVENKTYYGQQQQPGTIRDKRVTYYGNNDKKETKDNSLTQNYNRQTDQDYRNQHALYSNKDKTMFVQETGQRKQYLPVTEGHRMQCLQQIQATPQFEHNVQKNPLSSLENAAAPSMAAPVKDRQFSEVKAEQATTEHMKAQHTQAELAKAQHQAQVEQPKAESARLILAGQTGSEEVKAEQDRAEPSKCEKVRLRQAEPFKDKQRNEEQTEQSKEKHVEQARKEETKVKQTRVQKGIEKPSDITEEAGAAHMKNEQGEQVNAEQAEVDKLKEEHIKTELEETEQAQILTGHARREKINVEKVEEKQLKVEQIEIEQKNAKQIRTEEIKAEQVEKEQRKDDKAKHEQIKEQKAKTEQLNMREAEVERVKVDQIKIEDIQTKPKEDLNQAGRLNTEQPTTQLRTTKEAKTEAQTHVEVAKPELPKTEDLYEKLVKAGPNIKVIQQVKGQPDRVEQVKTELAKAKAELAKIKEKMRGEQKGKVKNTIVTDDITKKDDPLKVNVNKNEDFKKKDQVTEINQNKRDSLDFKNDFTNAVSTNGNKSARGDDNETPTLSLETVTKNKSNGKQSPKSGLATANTENKEVAISSKCNDLSEGHYVYSESSKEFKLLSSSSSPTNVDNKGNCDTVTEKNGTVEKLEKCEAVKHTDISQPRNSDSRKHDPLERKHRSTDHSTVSSKDLHFTPPRALSQKERAQTKQEILTSKIKAHAEKEISAIREKGLRDGFLSKNSSKQLAGSQSINIRQRPLIHEVSKKHESTVSSNNKPKHQIEPPGIQLETVKSVSPASSAATPLMSAVTTGQLVDSSQKQVPKEPVKSNDNVLVSSRNTKQTGCSTTITNLAENQEKKNQSGVNSPLKSKEHAINDNQAKQESNHEANAGKQKEERLKDDSVTSSDHRNEKKNDLSDAAALVKVTPTTNPEIKGDPEDSVPTLNPVLQDQNTTPMVDDSLQIMGIMVIVRERKPPETNGERDNSARESMNAKKKEGSHSELDKCHHSSGQASKENESSTEGNTAKTNNRVAQEMCPTEKKDQTKMNPPEIVPQTLSKRKNNDSERVTEKDANLQESSSINTKYQRETQLQKPMTEKSVPATVTAPAKNKVLAETQPLLSKQRMIESSMNDPSNKMPKENSAKTTMKAEEEINSRKTQGAHTYDTFMAKVDNTRTDFKTNSGRTDAESSIKHDVQLSSTKDVMTCINPSKSWNIDGKRATLLDEKTQDSTPPPHSLNENQNRCVTPKLQYKETFTEKKSQVDDVHIDSIAIRVVPSVTKEDKQDIIAGKHCVTVVPSDVVKATELQEVAPPRHEERVNTSNNDRIKDLAPANSDRQVEDKLGVQRVLASVRKLSDSLKNSKHSNTNGTQTGNGKPETVKERENVVVESKIKAMEGDYFQVQGAEETNDELHNSANFQGHYQIRLLSATNPTKNCNMKPLCWIPL